MAATKSAHPRKNYHPTVWGDFFITHVPATDEVVNGWNEEIEVLKSNIKKKLSYPINHVLERLRLIDAVQRLGVGYHFEKEIEQVLKQVHGDRNIWSDDDDNDLNSVALRFRLLRQHGYNVSSDVFNKFRSGKEGFKKELTDDIEGMLNLYEAAYFRTREESILGEAIEFTKAHLRAKVAEMEPRVAERVSRALERPLLKVVERVEHLYFTSSAYEHLEGHDPVLLKLAKLNFNLNNVARLYMEEERASQSNKDFVPTVEVYRQLSSLTTCFEWIAFSVLCGLGESVPRSNFEWLASSPEILIASTDICRLQDDLADNMKEQELEYYMSSVECYMKQYGVSRQEAVDGLKEIVEEDWMIINEELLMNVPSHICKKLPLVFLNLVRFMDTIYKDFDGYTHSSTRTKDILMALLVTPMVV
ncbi:unnamed protein product [Linum tenue]|uniref:Uncharacterized protein n=1 Tax=Linum tenue TaxID=586396 RepID=A0AAV0INH4_9ROSI|nr:unnamed protein product [Linum tenue]